ncbi:MAG TPA: M28 family peptidase [Caldilineae bacterium]|nr:M28 family peptidase [Caldilineae bacterium]
MAVPATEAERVLLEEISIEEPWALIERFSTLVRGSGSEDERIAAQYIADRLQALGVPHTVYWPELYLSVPRSASIVVHGSSPRTLRAKAQSFSASTGPEGLTGELVYVPPTDVKPFDEILDAMGDPNVDVQGKIVLAEGFGGPGPAYDFEQRGAIGQIFINPGERIHWGICTTIWGTPDLDTLPRKPRTPVVAINHSDGEALKEALFKGPVRVTIHADLTEGWTTCPLIVAEVPGTKEPEKFVLVHGHLDSWDVGIGDNAVGDATLLELARVFWKHRDLLKRSVRIAWWSGHSTGRYAGSTWYADTFALDLAEHCIAQVNIDSPGCRWATEYYDISWMAEAEEFCKRAIKDATGKEAEGGRPYQAGDYSFNNIGITSFFMLLSTMPRELIEEKGYYPVGGCGGNIGWHTEDDTLELADKDNLLRDLRVYVVALARVLNARLYPFNFVHLADEFLNTLARYQEAGKGWFDLSPSIAEARALREDLVRFYERASDPEVDPGPFNEALMRLARVLVPINYTRHGRFRTEPAVSIPPLPDLAPIMELGALDPDSDQARFTKAHLVRGQNRVIWAMREARAIVARALSKSDAS